MNNSAIDKETEAIKAADINNNESMKALFNTTAERYYLENTTKTFEQLNKEGRVGYAPGWADGLIGDEWQSIEDCIECAKEAASNAVEKEITEE